MADSTYTVDPTSFAVEKVELPEAPRFLFIRASLENAQVQDRELRRLAKSMGPADAQQAVAILLSEAIAAPKKKPSHRAWITRTRAIGCITPKLIPKLLPTRKKSCTSLQSFAPQSFGSRAPFRFPSWN